MADVQIKCPGCDGEMQLDGETERGVCPHCGNEVWRELSFTAAPVISDEEMSEIVAEPDDAFATFLIKKDFTRARMALEMGADVDAAPSYKGPAQIPHIVSAADFNELDVLEFLLEQGADAYTPVKLGEYGGEGTWLPQNRPDAFRAKCCFADPQYGTQWVEVSAALLADLHTDGRAAKLIAEKARKRDKGACYIATAVYGSYNAPQVRRLRRWRDEVLLQSGPGRMFVRVYYRLSPPLAARLAGAGWPNQIVKSLLNRLVKRLH